MIPKSFVTRICRFATATGHVGALLPKAAAAELSLALAGSLSGVQVSAGTNDSSSSALSRLSTIFGAEASQSQKLKLWKAFWASQDEDILLAGVIDVKAKGWVELQDKLLDPFVSSDLKRAAEARGVRLLRKMLASLKSHELIGAFLGKPDEFFLAGQPEAIKAAAEELFTRCQYSQGYLAYANGKFVNAEDVESDLRRASLYP